MTCSWTPDDVARFREVAEPDIDAVALEPRRAQHQLAEEMLGANGCAASAG